MITVGGIEIELLERGQGEPILYLHGGGGIASDLPFLNLLAKERRVIAPSHPGFGRSSLPDWLDSVDDISHVYIELMDRLGLVGSDVVGFSIGGWIAAEVASKVPERFTRLALIGPVGVKTGPPDKLDIPDIFALPQDALDRLRFHDPARNPIRLASMSNEELLIAARNRETLALISWEPYMHNPKLKHRLHRVQTPVLLVRGESDGIVSADYLLRYAALFSDSRIETIAQAGHLPHVEQPEKTANQVLQFLRTHQIAQNAGARP